MTDPARLPDPALVTPAGKACRQAGLPPPLPGLHREVLQFFLDHGSPPAGEWLPSQARARGTISVVRRGSCVDRLRTQPVRVRSSES